MKLLNNDELQWSTVVANNAMNRERVAFGVNSYEKEINFNPLDFIKNRVAQEQVNWADLCCGAGNELWQVANLLVKEKTDTKVSIVGFDLVEYFTKDEPNEILTLEQLNLNDWKPTQNFDLITIIHGLHYLGDKLKLISTAAAALKKDGVFIGNLDLDNIRINGVSNSRKFLLSFFKENNINYHQRKKLISITGTQNIPAIFQYCGADDQAGPNYTGQPVVDSYYNLLD